MGQTIKEWREARDLSQHELAEAVQVTQADVAEWELGRSEPTVHQLMALAAHLGVREDEIELEFRASEPPAP